MSEQGEAVCSDLVLDLHAAVFHGNTSLLDNLLKNGNSGDTDLLDARGNSPLQVACYYGQLECIKILLKYNADVNLVGEHGWTALHRAAVGVCVQYSTPEKPLLSIEKQQIEIVRLLVEKGAQLNVKDSSGDTPMDLACKNDFVKGEKVMIELNKKQEAEAAERLYNYHLSALYEACKKGDLAQVKELLQLAHDGLNSSVYEGRSLLMWASKLGYTNIVEHLIAEGAEATLSPETEETALHEACRTGHVKVVELLLQRLPALLALDECPGYNSFHVAAKNGHVGVIEFLFRIADKNDELHLPPQPQSAGVSIVDERVVFRQESDRSHTSLNPSLPDININPYMQSINDLRTPLHEAVSNGHFDVVKVYLEFIKTHPLQSNSTADLVEDNAATPTTYAPSPSHFSAGKVPFVHPAVDMLTLLGRTAFHEATKINNFDIMEVLLDAGADINAIMRPYLDRSANADLTALVTACMSNDVETVRFLLQHGATDARSKALTRSIKFKKHEVIGLILAFNNNVVATTEDRSVLPSDMSMFHSKILLDLNWNSKGLRYIKEEWLHTAVMECPRPKTDFCAISEVDLSSNLLEEVPLALFQLEQLLSMDLSRNQLSILPTDDSDCGWRCPLLRTVDIHKNVLKRLPACLFHLPKLKELTASENQLTQVPIDMWSALKLKQIRLSRNMIGELPVPGGHESSGSPDLLLPQTPNETSPVDVNVFSYEATMEYSSPDFNNSHIRTADSSSAFSSASFSFTASSMYSTSTQMMTPEGRQVGRPKRRTPSATYSNRLTSRRQLAFQDLLNDGTEELEPPHYSADEETCLLEMLDLAYNNLTKLPTGLACLTPKLKKLNICGNQVESLGHIVDYPPELEVLDASENDAISAIMFDSSYKERPSYIQYLRGFCHRKLLTPDGSQPTKPCGHWHHKTLSKLSTLKLNNNKLTELELFRVISKRKSCDLTIEEGVAEFAIINQTSGGSTSTRSSSSSSGHGSMRDVSLQKLPSDNNLTKSTASPTRFIVGGSDNTSGTSSHTEADDPKDTMIPVAIFPDLASLEIASNKLKFVPPYLHLCSHLASLNISHNEYITTLPLELSNLEHLWNLEYDDVPLVNPPAEDLDKFRIASDKLQYMRSLLHHATANESLKLMLVGLQRRGKTTLLSRLTELNEIEQVATTYNSRNSGETLGGLNARSSKNATGEPLSTVGVDLSIWKYRKDLEKRLTRSVRTMRSVTFYTWDFGGQEEYYVTHQCFLSTRSLYLLIWNVMDGEVGIDELAPWLHNIQARAPGSPVVLVGTNVDRLRSEVEKNQKKAEIVKLIYNKYLVGSNNRDLRERGLPKIIEIAFVGCPPNGKSEGIVELRQILYDVAFNLTLPKEGKARAKIGKNTKLLEQPIPASFLKLEKRIRELAIQCRSEDRPTLLRETIFKDKVKDIISNPRELSQAVSFLHENGILLHYDTPALSHLYFVDPQWLCDMLAHVVTVPEVNRFIKRDAGPDSGILMTNVLSHVFKGKVFPANYRNEYIELLSKFEVALTLDKYRLLVPSMLASHPKYTIHNFPNVFPRPPIQQVLRQFSDQASLFAGWDSSKNNGSIPAISADVSVTNELIRTGLLLRRFYFMSFVPNGFWPRLISRFLTDSIFFVIVLEAFGLPQAKINELMKEHARDSSAAVCNLSWSYWKTGIEFWYKELSVVRVAEVKPEQSYTDCLPSPSIFEHTDTKPIEPCRDGDGLTFELNCQWLPVDLQPHRGIEILVPDSVCPQIIQKGLNLSAIEREPSWMSAKLLAHIINTLDSLLEDWYPGIGARDAKNSNNAIPYVNRIIPCPFCVSGAVTMKEYTNLMDDSFATGSLPTMESTTPLVIAPTNTPEEQSSGRRSKIFNRFSSRKANTTAKRELFAQKNNTIDECDTNYMKSHSEPMLLPAASPGAADGDEDPLADTSGGGLMMVSKFGFMFEVCVLATRQPEQHVICPLHQETPLTISSLAPDLVFADLDKGYILASDCVDKGEYVDHGTFGEIYHGAVYPSAHATDSEGREVAIKIDKEEGKDLILDNACKAYLEMRSEVSILQPLKHPHIIEFIGVLLSPLCFVLEWAPGGSLHSLLQKYRKVDARISPLVLQETARQVVCGLVYLHEANVIYYDLKSPNVLVFKYPSAYYSIQCTAGTSAEQIASTPKHSIRKPGFVGVPETGEVYVKIADLGISRQAIAGRSMGFKGSPGFMAPEILKYMGTEACTNKVDMFSYAMFLYEMISLYFPYEKQNIMASQIEKLTIQGERPPLHSRELNSPMLYLDLMRWSWQQEYRHRPSSSQVSEYITTPAFSRLVDAIALNSNAEITCACIGTFLIETPRLSMSYKSSSPHIRRRDAAMLDKKVLANRKTSLDMITSEYSDVVKGDLQEEVWLGLYHYNETLPSSDVKIVSFRKKAEPYTDSITVCNARITAMCPIKDTMWIGNEQGKLYIYATSTRDILYERSLSINPETQAIKDILDISVPDMYHTVIVRQDGYVLLMDQTISERNVSDAQEFDNSMYSTELPVKEVSKSLVKALFNCGIVVPTRNSSTVDIWCGTNIGSIVVFSLSYGHITMAAKPCITCTETVRSGMVNVTSMVFSSAGGGSVVWVLLQPSNALCCVDTFSKQVINRIPLSTYTNEAVTSILMLNSSIHASLSNGRILRLDNLTTQITGQVLHGHIDNVYSIIPISCRTMPRQWLPSIIGRSNVIDKYMDLMPSETLDEAHSIRSSMSGRTTKLLVSLGLGYHGIAGRVEPLATGKDFDDNFLLLWMVSY